MDSSSFNNPSSTSFGPIISGRLERSPNQQAYLVRYGGQDMHVTLEEARVYAWSGLAIRDSVTREALDVFVNAEEVFAKEEEEDCWKRGDGKGNGGGGAAGGATK